MIDEEMFAALAAPFPPHKVSWRVGSVSKDKSKAMALAYVDARDVMDRLDAVAGPGGWERLHPHVDKTTTCEIRLKIPSTGEWVTKSDGAGDTAVEAEKGSLSDSFKRAAVNWGVGRYLYDLDSPWVKIDEWKKIAPEEMGRLRALLGRDASAKASAPPPIPVHEHGLFIACKAAIDLCGTKADMDHWAKNNAVSLERIKAEDLEVHAAVRNHYAKRLLSITEAKVAA